MTRLKERSLVRQMRVFGLEFSKSFHFKELSLSLSLKLFGKKFKNKPNSKAVK